MEALVCLNLSFEVLPKMDQLINIFLTYEEPLIWTNPNVWWCPFMNGFHAEKCLDSGGQGEFGFYSNISYTTKGTENSKCEHL